MCEGLGFASFLISYFLIEHIYLAYNVRVPAYRFTLSEERSGCPSISWVRGPTPLVLEVRGVGSIMEFALLLSKEIMDDGFLLRIHKPWTTKAHTRYAGVINV